MKVNSNFFEVIIEDMIMINYRLTILSNFGYIRNH